MTDLECPNCGSTGDQSEFTYLRADFNGIKKGDPDDLDMYECPHCEYTFDPCSEDGGASKRALRIKRKLLFAIWDAAAKECSLCPRKALSNVIYLCHDGVLRCKDCMVKEAFAEVCSHD